MEAELEMQEMITQALDAAAAGKATEEQVRLLAWQAGMTNWKPNQQKERK
jgi:uncharacterized protein YbcV (DUF1398 family)